MKTCVICQHNGLDKRIETVAWGSPAQTVLEHVTVYHCPECGERYEAIERAAELSHTLARLVIEHSERLDAPRIRFLRELLGLRGSELAERLGVAAATLYRWEAGDQQMNRTADRLLRVMVAWTLELKGFAQQLAQVALAEPTPWRIRLRFDDGWKVVDEHGSTHAIGL